MSYIRILIAILVSVVVYGCGNTHKNKETNTVTNTKVKDSLTPAEKVVIPGGNETTVDLSKIKTLTQKELKPFLYAYGEKNPETKIKIMTVYGDITVKLFKDTPLHRANFIYLTKLGYFNTTFFHRVVEGFVIQGGNSDKIITQKFRAAIGDFLIPSETSPKHKHVRGAFSMSKYLNQNISDASSPYEFFIVQDRGGAHHLDGEHTVFGEVIDGMEVVDKINQLKIGNRQWPLNNVYIDIKVID